jgi:hypothetical protein
MLMYLKYLFAVSLQPQQGEFPGSENYKHKFMVQTMFAPDGEYDADQLVIILPSFYLCIQS